MRWSGRFLKSPGGAGPFRPKAPTLPPKFTRRGATPGFPPKPCEMRDQAQSTWFDTYPGRGASSCKNLGIVFQVLYSHSSAARPSSSETPTTRGERHGLENFARRAAHSTSQSPMLCRDRWRPASPGQLLRAGRRWPCSTARGSIAYGSPPCSASRWSRVLSEVFVRCLPKGMNHSRCSQH